MRKQDLMLLRKIKKEEQSNSTNKVEAEIIADEVGSISFDLWWNETNKKLNQPAHVKEIVWAEFKSRGLKKEDLPSKYDIAIVLFGYKI